MDATTLELVSKVGQTVLMAVLPVLAASMVNWAVRAAQVQLSHLDSQKRDELTWIVSRRYRPLNKCTWPG